MRLNNHVLQTVKQDTLKNIFLFSIDLEDIRNYVDDGHKYPEAVPRLTDIYLNFLHTNGLKTTFFVVGDVARKYPEVINKIFENGHEIACHTLNHTTLDKLTPAEFKNNLKTNIEILKECGVKDIYGFRAPTFSLTKKSQWVYDILSDFGFVYSSSVLPAKNPLFGWPDFGLKPKIMKSGIVELPMTVTQTTFLSMPFAGGIYMRVLPFFLIKYFFKKAWQEGLPVLGYLHPYDIDSQQEKFMHPGIRGNKMYNYLMYVNRKGLLLKLQKIINFEGRVMRYVDYVKTL